MEDRIPRTGRIRCRFSIGSLLLLTIGTAGLLAVLVRPVGPLTLGPLTTGAACLLWIVAGGLAGALDVRVSRGLGALRGPALGGVLGGALAGLILSVLGMAAARFGRPQLVWPGPGFLFYAYWWASTGAIVGGALGCLVSRRPRTTLAAPADRFSVSPSAVTSRIDDVPLRLAPLSSCPPRITWRARWLALWSDSPGLFASVHLHVVVWTLLGIRAFGMAGDQPLAKPAPLDPLLATWSDSWVDGSTGEQSTPPAWVPAERAVAHVTIKNPPAPPVDQQRAPTGGPSQDRQSGSGLVHVVGLYEGTYPNGVSHRFNFHPQGSADVRVTQNAGPTILVLCSYEPVKWNVRLDPGAVVERVILSGYHRQEVAGLPEGVPVSSCSYDERSPSYYYAYQRDVESYPGVARAVREATGQDIATLQGSYSYSGSPFVVGPESKTWAAEYERYKTQDLRSAQRAEAQRAAREKIGDLSFHGIWKSTQEDRGTHAFGLLTLDGPVEGQLRPVSRLRVMAVDPAGPKYYAIQDQCVVELDAELKWKKELHIRYRPRGLAYDTKRRRLVLASQEGNNSASLSVQEPRGRWSLLADLKDVDLAALAYSEEDDVLYGIDHGRGVEGTMRMLRKYSPKGKLLSTVKISKPISLGTILAGPQLFAVGSHLVILGPAGVPNLAHEPRAPSIVVVDPASGQVLWSRGIPDDQLIEPEEE